MNAARVGDLKARVTKAGHLDPSRKAVVAGEAGGPHSQECAVERPVVVSVSAQRVVRGDEPAEHFLQPARHECVRGSADRVRAPNPVTEPALEVRDKPERLVRSSHAVRPRHNKAIHGPVRRPEVQERSDTLVGLLDMVEPIDAKSARRVNPLRTSHGKGSCNNRGDGGTETLRGIAQIHVRVPEKPRRPSPVVIRHKRERAPNEEDRDARLCGEAELKA